MLYTFLCLLLPLCHTHTYPPEVYRIMYGNLGFEDLFLPEIDDADVITPEENDTISKLDVLALLRSSYIDENLSEIPEQMQNITVDSIDAADYNEISSKIYNITRKKWYSTYKGLTDENDWWPTWVYSKTLAFEEKKIMMFRKICIMFLHHARYKIESAFKQREPIRSDKRYKLGYLFNRLRRIKTEMLKFAAIAKMQYEFNNHECENLTSLMRLYERVVYFDVDIRDTTAHIIQIYSKTESIDFESPDVTNADGDNRVTPKMAPPMHGGSTPPGRSAEQDDYRDDLDRLKNQYGG